MDWFSDCCFEENGEINHSCDLLIIGSALFYKGFLISSHLPGHYLSDVVSFIKYRGIISLTKQQPVKLVIWQEVYPLSEKKDTLANDFKENDGTRFFLLVVAVEQTLLCTLLEMPFLCSDLKTKPNELIINQTLRFVASTLNRSGLIQELNEHLRAQSYLFTNTWSGGSPVCDRIKQSLSARELADLGGNSKTEVSSCEEDHWSENSSLPSNPLTKSLSSPSISVLQSQSQQQASTSINNTLSPPTHLFSPAPAAPLSSTSASSLDKNSSFLPNENTIDTNSCSRSSIPSCIDYYSQDLHFPDYLLFYIDMDLNSRTFYGPVITESHKPLSPNLSKTLRDVAIYLSDKLNKHYPGLTEIGNHFEFKDAFLNPAVRFKNKKYMDSELNLWVVGRKETPDREIFLFFRVPTKGRRSNSFLPTESLFNRLLVQNK
uniref:CCZ1/INTU second Longin domain-containing protein n=2 Tax=Tetranychus urticae TaxID=32264 RepID=T1JT96_TETUR